MEHWLKFITLLVSVPVLSVKTYSIWPNSSLRFHVRGTHPMPSLALNISSSWLIKYAYKEKKKYFTFLIEDIVT